MKQLQCRNISLGHLKFPHFGENISLCIQRTISEKSKLFVHLKDTCMDNKMQQQPIVNNINKGTTWLYIFDKSPNVSNALNCHINHRSRVREEVEEALLAKMFDKFEKKMNRITVRPTSSLSFIVVPDPSRQNNFHTHMFPLLLLFICNLILIRVRFSCCFFLHFFSEKFLTRGCVGMNERYMTITPWPDTRKFRAKIIGLQCMLMTDKAAARAASKGSRRRIEDSVLYYSFTCGCFAGQSMTSYSVPYN